MKQLVLVVTCTSSTHIAASLVMQLLRGRGEVEQVYKESAVRQLDLSSTFGWGQKI